MALPLLVFIAALIIMRSPLVGSVVRGQIKSATGADLLASRIFLRVDGRLILDNPSLRVPGLDGPAGEVMSAQRAIIDLNWGAWASGGVQPTALRLDGPVFRVSQSLDDQSVNLSGLSAVLGAQSSGSATGGTGGGASGSMTDRPPQVDILNGRIEFAEHSVSRGSFETHHTIQVAGSLLPTDPAKGLFALRLQEIGRATPVGNASRGMILDGRLDIVSNRYSLRLLNLPLDAFPPDAMPVAYRETWRRLNVIGKVTESSFNYAPDTGIKLDIALENVALDIPVPTYAPTADPTDSLSISQVNGNVTLSTEGLSADLTGLLEEQTTPSRVRLETKGLDLNAALRCEITGRNLNVAKNPSFYPYVPDKVREYFTYFGGPTADFDARVVIVRDATLNNTAAPIRITDGRLVFRNGTAAFHKFPYPFSDMAGTVEFSESRLEIRDITGRGPTGAEMTAYALIEPLNKESEVRVQVSTRRTPIDPFLLDAMPNDDRRVLETLFSRPDYDRLVERGLVVSSGERALLERDADDLELLLSNALGQPETYAEQVRQLRSALESIAPRLAAPVFDLAGDADISVDVFSPRGEDQPYFVNVDVKFPEAGILPEPFPYPIRATDFALQVSPERAELIGGDFQGLRGGTARLSAEVLLEEDGERCVRPDIRIGAFNIPVDDLLIAALPDTSNEEDEPVDASFVGPPSRPMTAAAICQALDVRGTIDAGAVISAEPSNESTTGTVFVSDLEPVEETTPDDPITYEAYVTLDRLSAGPRTPGINGLVRIVNVQGLLQVRPDRIAIERFSGQLRHQRPGEPNEPASGVLAADLRLTLLAGLDNPAPLSAAVDASGEEPIEPGQARVQLAARDVSLSAPIEQLVSLFSTDAGGILTNIRGERDPAGFLDLQLNLDHRATRTQGASVAGTSEKPAPLSPAQLVAQQNTPKIEYGVVIDDLRGVTMALNGGRLGLTSLGGSLRIEGQLFGDRSDPRDNLRVRAQEASVEFAFDSVPAGVAVAEGGFSLVGDSLALAGPADFAGQLQGARIESELFRRLIRDAVGPRASPKFDALDLRGLVDARATVQSQGDGPEANPSAPVLLSGSIQPRNWSFDDGAGRVEMSLAAGRIEFRGGQASLPSSNGTTGLDTTEQGETTNFRAITDWRLGGEVRGLDLQAEDLSALVDGQWTYAERSGLTVQADFSVKAESLTPRHRRLLPESVSGVLDSLGVQMNGPWTLEPARWTLQQGPRVNDAGPPPKGVTKFDSVLTFSDAAMDLGASLSQIDGRVRLSTDKPAEAESPGFEVELLSADLRAAGATLTDARALIVSKPDDEVVRVPFATASCHGGRVWAVAEILPGSDVNSMGAETAADQGAAGRATAGESVAPVAASSVTDSGLNSNTAASAPVYRADIGMAGVAFAPLLAELGRGTGAVAPLARAAEDPARFVGEADREAGAATSRRAEQGEVVTREFEGNEDASALGVPGAPLDLSRGRMDARLSLQGRAGDPLTRVGRGSIRVASGNVLRMPVVFQLMQISNLAFPTGDELDYLQAGFTLEGRQARFEQIAILSDSIALLGNGTVTFPDLALDLTFNSRGTSRIPLLSDLYEMLRNEIATTRVRGTVEEPDIQARPLVGTGRVFANLFNPGDPEQEPMSAEAFEAAREERERFKGLLTPAGPRAEVEERATP